MTLRLPGRLISMTLHQTRPHVDEQVDFPTIKASLHLIYRPLLRTFPSDMLIVVGISPSPIPKLQEYGLKTESIAVLSLR